MNTCRLTCECNRCGREYSERVCSHLCFWLLDSKQANSKLRIKAFSCVRDWSFMWNIQVHWASKSAQSKESCGNLGNADTTWGPDRALRRSGAGVDRKLPHEPRGAGEAEFQGPLHSPTYSRYKAVANCLRDKKDEGLKAEKSRMAKYVNCMNKCVH